MLDDAWDCARSPARLGRSSSAALDAVEELRSAGRSAVCVVLPPGMDWPALGLAVARGLRRRTLVLTPNTAVQGQWQRTWAASGGAVPPPGSVDGAVTVVTTLGLSAWHRGADDEPVEDDTSPLLAQSRRSAVLGADGADLLSLLHPAGRALLERAAAAGGPWTLVLDESASLLETWGPLVGALARALGTDTWVLGLSATPSELMAERPRALHSALFDGAEVDVSAPSAVVRGDLAPYQELVLVTAPTPDEDAAIDVERTRFADLSHELLVLGTGTLPFVEWLRRRLHDRGVEAGGERRSWRALARDEPALARAGLRLVHAGVLALPSGARLAEEHRAPADGDDWAVLLGAYASEQLAGRSAADDVRLLTGVTQVLPGLGWSLTDRGLRPTASPVEQTCTRSAAKAAAALDVLAAELDGRGEELRALVVCDAEQGTQVRRGPAESRLRPGAPAPGSADAAFLALAGSDLAEVLRPVLCTGRTLALRREDLAALRAFAPARVADRLVAESFAGHRSVVRISGGQGWDARAWVPLVTDWLAEGGTRALVGTRALLGLGWSCPSLSVVVDLTTSSAATTVRQVHGRAPGLDPGRPQEVADTWTVACVADGHPRGGADLLRVARAAEHVLAPADDGTVEAGIGHADGALAAGARPSPEVRAAVAGRAAARVTDRGAVRQAWTRCAEDGVARLSLRVRSTRPLGLPADVVPAPLLTAHSTLGAPAPAPLPRTPQRGRLWPLPVGAAVAVSAGSTATLSAAVGAGAGLATGLLLGGIAAGSRWRSQSAALDRLPADPQAAVLRSLAAVVADALRDYGATSTGAAGVDVTTSGDEHVCVLDGPVEDARRFASSLDELLAPLGEPRWLVSRFVLPVPAGPAERRALVLARTFGRPVEAPVTWHAVPAALTRSRAGVDAFEAAWQAHVGAGRLVLARDPEGAALLELLQGQDPFGVTTRLRTVWR